MRTWDRPRSFRESFAFAVQVGNRIPDLPPRCFQRIPTTPLRACNARHAPLLPDPVPPGRCARRGRSPPPTREADRGGAPASRPLRRSGRGMSPGRLLRATAPAARTAEPECACGCTCRALTCTDYPLGNFSGGPTVRRKAAPNGKPPCYREIHTARRRVVFFLTRGYAVLETGPPVPGGRVRGRTVRDCMDLDRLEE